MTAIGDDTNDSVKNRLIHAADAEIAERGLNAVQMEAIAKRAGVSRATAFRQLGSIAEAVIAVALLRSERQIHEVHRIMAAKTGALAKLEVGMIHSVLELPKDPAISVLMTRPSASANDPRAHDMAMLAVGDVLAEGQRNGEIRTDLSLDEMGNFLIEQTFLAAEERDPSEEAARKRFRHFVAPALAARGDRDGQLLSRTREVENAVSNAMDALQQLAQYLNPER